MRLTRRALLHGLASAAAARQAFAAADTGGVASTELILTETLLALGVAPVAVGNRPLYERLVGTPALPASATDLGPLNEPNLELLQFLRPRLILAAEWQRATQGQLERIAPVAWLPTFSLDGAPLENARALALRIGALTETEARAAELAGEFDTRAEELSARLATLPRRAAYVVRFMEDGRHLLVFGTGSLPGAVLDAIGVENAWAGPTSMWGSSFAGIESLIGRPDAAVLHFAGGQSGSAAPPRGPLWRALSHGAAERMKPLQPAFPAGGLASALRLAEAVATAMQDGDARE